MPKRTDIHTILIIGSGPIVIGQGCEFDYSGVQACRALKEEGYRVVLVNSNPATIMTDPEFADATYIEPITPEAVEKILIREAASGHPIDALLPTLGGQTGLNTGMACASSSSAVAEAYFDCSSPAYASRRKSFGKALLCPRSAASLARRSAISLFSSCGISSLIAYSPAFRLASMNWSRSPSSTLSVAPTSTLVRRSLMRDWSST